VAAQGSGTYIGPMQYKLEHRIGVPASSSLIWNVLSDLGRWPEWNPIYPEIEGLLRIALKMRIKETFPGAPPRIITPIVVDWVPNSQILWLVKEAGGLVKRIRYIEIEILNDEDKNCIVSNGEVYDGLLGPTVGKRNRRVLKAGFQALGEAVVERVRQVQAGEAVAEGDRG
jgi:hypothetical protein